MGLDYRGEFLAKAVGYLAERTKKCHTSFDGRMAQYAGVTSALAAPERGFVISQ